MTEIYWTKDRFIGIGIMFTLMFIMSFILLLIASFVIGGKIDISQTTELSLGIGIAGLILSGIGDLIDRYSKKEIKPE